MRWTGDALRCLRNVALGTTGWMQHDRWEFASEMLDSYLGVTATPEECRKEARRRGWAENPNQKKI